MGDGWSGISAPSRLGVSRFRTTLNGYRVRILTGRDAPDDQVRHALHLRGLDLGGSGAPEGSIATSAFTLSGALSGVEPKLPPWLCTTITQGQTLCTARHRPSGRRVFVTQRGTPCLPNWSNASTGNCWPSNVRSPTS